MESQLAKFLEDGGVNHTMLSVLEAEDIVSRSIFVALRKEHSASYGWAARMCNKSVGRFLW